MIVVRDVAQTNAALEKACFDNVLGEVAPSGENADVTVTSSLDHACVVLAISVVCSIPPSEAEYLRCSSSTGKYLARVVFMSFEHQPYVTLWCVTTVSTNF